MNDFKIYFSFNPPKNNMNAVELKKTYIRNINNTSLVRNINDFYKKYKDFDLNFYKKLYELEDKNSISIMSNFHLYGFQNNYISNKKEFYRLYPEFNHNYYKNEFSLDINKEDDLIIHYYRFNKHKLNNLNKNFSYQNRNIEIKIKKNIELKIAHLFVHFFKIGGGENFIYNYEKKSKFMNTIFVSNEYNTECFINIDSNIIVYKNLEELKILLQEYDIIIDHQLYFFYKNNEYNNIFKNLDLEVIQFIHGVDIYKSNINKMNFNYSINLYEENKKDLSWNYHIKYKNYLGINNNPKKKIYKNIKKDNINVCIVGRIDNHKVPLNFLKLLFKFSNVNSNFIFNFYGVIDDNYKKIINNCFRNSENIKYHGYIENSKINNIYTSNDILMMPSLSEAGATVILEAMNNGLLIICRNSGGNSETLQGTNFICNNDNQFFDTLLMLKDINTENIYHSNIKKTLTFNNNENNLNSLNDIIQEIHNTKNDKIPNIVHYIYGLDEQKDEFLFINYISLLSNVLINKPEIIYFHYQYEPYGYWWNKIKRYLRLNKINTKNFQVGNKELVHYAHKSDYLRLYYLLKYGGIYYDIDTLCLKNHSELLNNELVLGIQENYKNEYDLICNAIIYSQKNNFFIKLWLDNFIDNFDRNKWCEASMHLPSKLYKNLDFNLKSRIKLLNNEYFYYPNYNQLELLFHNDKIEINNLITYHYWNSESKKYLYEIKNIDYILNTNNLFSKMLSLINNEYHKNYLNNHQYNIDDNKYSKVFSISIILLDNYDNLIIDIVNQKNLFYLDIEILVIDNNYKDNINEELIRVLYYKNIDLKIIECFEEKDNEFKIDIGNLIRSKDNLFLLNSSIDNNYLINLFNNEKVYNSKINHNYFIDVEKNEKLINEIKNILH